MIVTLVAIADTHLFHDDLVVPDGDILVHAGDLTRNGNLEELAAAAAFLRVLPHESKVVIAGNHDFCLQRAPVRARRKLQGLTYLEDEAATICGLRFWGSPWQPWFFDWAFNLPRGPALAARWARIPTDTDVLVTHGPPRGHGDRTADDRREGCDDLLARVEAVQPMLHVFGHIHEDRGTWRVGRTVVANVTTNECELEPTVFRIDTEARAVEVVRG